MFRNSACRSPSWKPVRDAMQSPAADSVPGSPVRRRTGRRLSAFATLLASFTFAAAGQCGITESGDTLSEAEADVIRGMSGLSLSNEYARTRGEVNLFQAIDLFKGNTLIAGVRFEHNSLYCGEWVPQAGISWNPVKDTYLKLSASKGFRTPNMRELYMFPPANKDLKPERAWSYDFAVDHHFLDGRLNTELSLFYTKGDNIIAIVPLAGKPKNQNVGSFENMGVEASSDFRLPANLSIHANYSYLDMKPPVTGAPRHKLYCGLNYNPGRFSFQLGGMWIDHLRLDLKGDATESYVLVNARASYRLFDWMKRVVRGGRICLRRSTVRCWATRCRAQPSWGASA